MRIFTKQTDKKTTYREAGIGLGIVMLSAFSAVAVQYYSYCYYTVEGSTTGKVDDNFDCGGASTCLGQCVEVRILPQACYACNVHPPPGTCTLTSMKLLRGTVYTGPCQPNPPGYFKFECPVPTTYYDASEFGSGVAA
jgi:hypothetical protein